VITSRPEAITAVVRSHLYKLGFGFYEICPFTQQEVEPLFARIGGAAASDIMNRLPPELYQRPLMATLAAHYWEQAHVLEVGMHTKACVMSFMRQQLTRNDAEALGLPVVTTDRLLVMVALLGTVREYRLYDYRGVACLLRLTRRLFRLNGFDLIPWEFAWCRSATKQISRELLRRAHCIAFGGSDGEAADLVFDAARRGRLRSLEPSSDGKSVEFKHLVIQEYFASACLYEFPSVPQVQLINTSMGSIACSVRDGLDEVRDNMCDMVVMSPCTNHPELCRIASRAPRQDAIDAIICAGFWDGAHSFSKVPAAALFGSLRASLPAMRKVIHQRFTFANLVVACAHQCLWAGSTCMPCLLSVLLAVVLSIRDASVWLVCCPAVAAPLFLVLSFETMPNNGLNWLICLPWTLVCWARRDWRNMLLVLPATVCTAVCSCAFFAIFGLLAIFAAPSWITFRSSYLRAVHPFLPHLTLLILWFCILGSLASLLMIAIPALTLGLG